MKAKYFFLALSAIALGTSCSNDEVTEVSDSNAIKFSVSTGKMSRAADVFCSNNKPGSFYVWANHDSKTYIAGDLIQDEGTNTENWVNQSGNRYWPETGNLNFYGHVNAGNCFTWNTSSPTTAPTIVNFTVGTDVSKQVDLLYAVATGQNKGANASAGVTMNFRHALSQIVFRAKNTNPNLYVEVYGVTVCNLGNVNTYTYPTESTKDNYEDHNDSSESTENNKTGKGSWGTLTSGNTDYNIKWETPFTVTGNQTNPTVVDLFTAHKTGEEFSDDAMLLLPQNTTEWDGTGKASDATGTYFLLKCNIYNVAGAIADTDNDVLLWGESGKGKEVAIPVKIDWTQGNKYIYTFVFGDGNGGHNPDDGDPILTPITFTVDVDDFDLVADTEVDMETN